MSEFNPTEKGVPIRQGATANFLIDSRDRTGYNLIAPTTADTAADFFITKKNSLMNGYFTRIAPQDVCLDYCLDNINTYWGNAFINFIPSTIQTTGMAYPSTIQATLPNGGYTVANALDAITTSFNSNTTATNNSLTLSTLLVTNGRGGNAASLGMFKGAAATAFKIPFSTSVATASSGTIINLAGQLDLDLNTAYANSFVVDCPKLLPTSYLDFVSPTLTQNQNVKDGSTSQQTTDILYRWYLAWGDVPEPLDAYGYQIFQGYKRFIQHRQIPFPKQIRWMPNIPIGQLGFQVLDDQGRVLPASMLGYTTTAANNSELEWQMTCLASET
jgi:hypothetical protein